MSAILSQLGVDKTFFYQLACFALLFLILSPLYFKEFLKLIEARHQATVADREAAEKMMVDADAKFEEYKRRMAEERVGARKEYEAILAEAKKEEAQILGAARAQAKQITQQAVEDAAKAETDIKRKLELDVESLAQQISEKLVSRTL